MVTTRPSTSSKKPSIFAVVAKNRSRRLLQSGIEAFDDGFTVRVSARTSGTTVNSFMFELNQAREDVSRGHRQLTNGEERLVVDLLLKTYSRKGRVVVEDLMNAVQEFVRQLPKERQQQISFNDGVPSRQFCLSFEHRHRDSFYFVRHRNEEVAWTACNAYSLTLFFTQVARVREELKVDRNLVFCAGKANIFLREEIRSAVCRSGGEASMWRAAQVYDGSVSILAAVCADGSFRRPVVLHHCSDDMYKNLGTTAHMPLSGYAHLDVGQGSFGQHIFPSCNEDVLWHWATHLIKDLQPSLYAARRAILLFDPLHLPFSAKAIQKLTTWGVIPIPIPEHTHGCTLPLQSGVGLWKKLGNAVGDQLVDVLRYSGGSPRRLPLETIRQCIEKGFEDAFTSDAVLCAFREHGLQPMDEFMMFQRARPWNLRSQDAFANLSQMSNMVAELSKKCTYDLFVSDEPARGTGSAVLSALGHTGAIQGRTECPCKLTAQRRGGPSGTPHCVHELFGRSDGYAFCACGLGHVPHMCVGRMFFPLSSMACSCKQCARCHDRDVGA